MQHRQRIDPYAAGPRGHRALLDADRALREEALIDSRLRELVLIRTAQLNGCAHSLERHTKEALRLGESPERLTQLPAWRDSPLFTPTARAALALTETVTRLPPDGVGQDIYDDAENVLGPRNLAHLVLTVALANALDRVAVTARLPPVSPV
ncbi:carboxymuconolactone decarboxylase family protein [Streptomyces sp. NPDC003006]